MLKRFGMRSWLVDLTNRSWLDFANLRTYPPEDLTGLAVFRLRRQDKNLLIKAAERIIPLLNEEDLQGRLWIVEEDRVRIRGGESQS